MSFEEDMSEYELEQRRSSSKDPKQRWINKIISSIQRYYKKCPHYDFKTGMCLIMDSDNPKCPRDGRYEGCPILEEFLSKKYDYYKSKGVNPPYDFRDLALI